MDELTPPPPPPSVQVSFSHVHVYTDHIDDISVYKQLEDNLNSFGERVDLKEMRRNIAEYKHVWEREYCGSGPEENDDIRTASSLLTHVGFISQGRDLIKQLLAGLGFRITGYSDTMQTRSVLVTTKDPHGVQFVISSLKQGTEGGEYDDDKGDDYSHFHSRHLKQFYREHNDRQGIAVLAFQITEGNIESLYERYKTMHPKLLPEDYKDGVLLYEDHGKATSKILEVYSYYKNEKGGQVDKGTKLRFVQKMGSLEDGLILPGLIPVKANFDKTCMNAYCDHWVSNVISRTGFLETLEETLGFTTKVDFNAGVVAAGEAQIESTVTGNDSSLETFDKEKALTDQSQVYLPINNALNEYSHVYGFLEELGQGVQHIASRVDDLPAFVQRGNDFREITGEGFTFLKIPRSYYGVLTKGLLQQSAHVTEETATSIMECCETKGVMSMEGAIDLNLNADDLTDLLSESLDRGAIDEYETNKKAIVEIILRSRYINMFNLLGDILNEDTYLSIVRNQILVDVQGGDLLFQIFTSNILQRNAGDEAPFLEFIQRVCAQCTVDGCPIGMKAGCGGFGIRNFLTLFLSIEIGKAMLEVSHARASDDESAMKFSQKKVDAFTDQLNESNPILTAISDAMTEEGRALERMQDALSKGDDAAAAEYEAQMKAAAKAKHESNLRLMELNAKYNEMMKSLRLNGAT
jgi:hypothetical protein